MTAHQPHRRWSILTFALVVVAGLVATGPAAEAAGNASDQAAPVALTWAPVSPPVAPPPLAYASAAYDSDNQTIVLFGGSRSNGSLSNDTWVWDGSTWTDFSGSEVQAPPARMSASMAFDPKLHQLILFGGEGASGQPLGDTWAWNGASWYEQTDQVTGPSPSPRQGAALAYDGAGHLVLFGGTGYADAPANAPAEAPAPTTTSTTTTTVPPAAPTATSTTSTTTAIDDAAVQSTPGALSVLADTWTWTATGWTPGPASGPPARSGAAMAFDGTDGETVLFGGESTPAGSISPKLLDDTWSWNGKSWAHLAPAVHPPARDDAVTTADGLIRGVVLFGGSGTRGPLGDTWLWNGSTWAAPHTAGSPAPRTGPAAAFDADGGQLLLFGGRTAGGGLLADTVILADQAPVALGAGPTSTSHAATTVTSPTQTSRPSTPKTSIAPAGTSTPGTRAPAPYPPVAVPTRPPLVATHHVLHRGDLVTLSGAGFRDGATITISFHSTPTVVGRAVANSRGFFSATVAVPASAKGGTHHFEAAGLGSTGQTAELTATVDVVGVPVVNGRSSTVQLVVLTAAALVIPGGTWFGLGAAGRLRRRRAALR
jgi:Galactose oxidase, central domain